MAKAERLPAPLVSVIMAMRNSASTIETAIRSIQMQTLDNWELILIDDGSTDASVEVAKTLADSRIHLQFDGKHLGLAARLNQAVAMSKGEFIARMDADDVCFPARLAKQVEILQGDVKPDLVGCHALVFTDSGDIVGVMRSGLDHRMITAHPFDGFPLPHPTWCGRARWFRENPYDAKLMKTQDQDLLLRSFSTSRFAVLDRVLMGYRQDQPNLAKKIQGRLVFAGSLLRYAGQTGQYTSAVSGILKHFGKAVVDVGAAVFGLSRFAQRNRFQPASPDVGQEWSRLWQSLNCKQSVKSCAE